MFTRKIIGLAVTGAALGWGAAGAVATPVTDGIEGAVGISKATRAMISLKDGSGSGINSWIGNLGGSNIATGLDSAVTAGTYNAATAQGAFVGAGTANAATGISSLVIGGFDNRATAIDSLVASGAGNRANGARSVVIGGGYNLANGQWSFIGGGGRDGIESTPAGTDGRDNIVTGNFGALVGGQGNTVAHAYGFVGGGHRNFAQGPNGPSTVGGGGCNAATGDGSTIAGGGQFSVSAACTFGNTAEGASSTIGGGFANLIPTTGSAAVISGGRDNLAKGARSVVPGGELNFATGANSFAAGFRAKTQTAGGTPVVHDGTFVWSDGNPFDFNSSASNQFNVRSTGGVRIVSAIDAGNGAPTAGVTLGPGDGAWNTLSDRAVKENWRDVDAREVLEKLAAMPIGEWNYIAQGGDVRHLGPAAQDFHAAFGLGSGSTTISTVDADGVALAAIQGLKQLVDEKDARIRKLESDVASMSEKGARLAALERELAAIRAMLGSR